MPKPRITAREIRDDVRNGMSEEELAAKYQLSQERLNAVLQKLVDAGHLSREELEGHSRMAGGSEEPAWICPACNKPQQQEYEACPECGVKASALRARQLIESWKPAQGLQSLLQNLQSAGISPSTGGVQNKPAPKPRTNGAWECPGCGTLQQQEVDECPRCGLIVAKHRQKQEQEQALRLAELALQESALEGAETVWYQQAPAAPPTPPLQTDTLAPDAEPPDRPVPSPPLVTERPSVGAGLSPVADKLSDVLGLRDLQAKAPSEDSSQARDLRIIGKFFTVFGLTMAALGVLGGMLKLVFGQSAAAFGLIGYSVLLIVIGGPIWLLCKGVSELISLAGELSDAVEEQNALLRKIARRLGERE